MTNVSAPPRPAARHARLPERVTFDAFVQCVPKETKEDLINGFIVPAMSAGLAHEQIFGFLYAVMRVYASAKGLGVVLGSRTLVRIDERNGFEPDLLFVATARQHLLTERALLGAPDVAVEIVSASSRTQDRDAKFAGYERAGVLEYWLLDPARGEASFYRRGIDGLFAAVETDADGVFASHAMPGFRLRPSDLFAAAPPSELDVLRGLLDGAPPAS